MKTKEENECDKDVDILQVILVEETPQRLFYNEKNA
jgi:hypothetical protein